MIKKIISLVAVLAYMVVSPVVAMAATLGFNPSSGTFNKGCEVSIKIDINTEGIQTDGTDVIVIYSPAQLSTTTSQITNGTVYPDYPGNSVDSASGRISISGISSVSSPFTGTGTFATIKFNVASSLTAGAPVLLKFDFDPNNKTKTTDTNIVERGTIADVLSGVTDGNYTVGTGQCNQAVNPTSGSTTGSTTGSTSGSGTGSSTSTGGQGQTLPGTTGTSSTPSAVYQVYRPKRIDDLTGNGVSSGLLDNTIVISAIGAFLVILGVVGLALL